MAKKSLLLLHLKIAHHLTEISPSADEFCGEVFIRKRLSIFSRDDETKTVFIGKARKVIKNRKSYESYDRCIFKSGVALLLEPTEAVSDELRFLVLLGRRKPSLSTSLSGRSTAAPWMLWLVAAPVEEIVASVRWSSSPIGTSLNLPPPPGRLEGFMLMLYTSGIGYKSFREGNTLSSA
ncbi:hypothetical protein QAD02_018608 [Eretmocerus hayati]|uniref:Uncharacterized protein n=1 Tax=Eretmocerus hayati TaxID=131215 RepID=A0ACC2PIG2_9HYME|nr:hypothetical protein QAD02_018608 [Eretmocerus hayati]